MPPKVYSPSSRTDYSFCPRYWWLRKRWTSRRVGYPELCAIGGSAFSEAMNLWNTTRIHRQAVTVAECVAVGQSSIQQAIHEATAQGRHVIGKDVEFMDTLPSLLQIAVETIWAANPLEHHTIVASEHEFIHFGKARVDVISRDAQDELVVDDYKCKFGKFNPAWMNKEFDKHFDGEQRMAYTQMVGCELFGIILVVIQPSAKGKIGKPMVVRRTSRVRPNEVALWKNDASIDYTMMAQVEMMDNPWNVPGKAGPHANQYGDCPFKEACVEDGLDRDRMAIRYIPIIKEV